jgi:mono/diheme cytochrome c family protein
MPVIRARFGARVLSLALTLSACAAVGAAPSKTADGEALFMLACATCHLGGGGLLGAAAAPAPELLQDPLPRGDSAEVLFRLTRDGVGSPQMPAFGAALSDAEIREIVGFIRKQRALEGGSP